MQNAPDHPSLSCGLPDLGRCSGTDNAGGLQCPCVEDLKSPAQGRSRTHYQGRAASLLVLLQQSAPKPGRQPGPASYDFLAEEVLDAGRRRYQTRSGCGLDDPIRIRQPGGPDCRSAHRFHHLPASRTCLLQSARPNNGPLILTFIPGVLFAPFSPYDPRGK